MTPDATLAVGPASGSAPVQEVSFSGSVTVQLDLKSGTNLQFVTRASDPAALYIDELATDIWVLGSIIQLRLRAWAVWQEWFINGQDNVSVMGVTYKKLLSRRLVNDPAGLSFTNTDLGQIIWGMWQHTQSLPGGNLGITQGTPNTTGLVRSRTYKQGENLGQMADDEYEEGIWWSIDHNLVYTCGKQSDGGWLSPPLHLGANVRTMQRAAGSDFANVAFGDADDATTTPVIKTAPNVATDPRGRWELAGGWPTVKLQQTLDDRTTALLIVSNFPVAHWNVELEPSRWLTDSRLLPGMFAVLIVPRTLAAPIGQAASSIVVFVTQVSITFDEDGALMVKAVVEERPDLPVPATAVPLSTPRLIGV